MFLDGFRSLWLCLFGLILCESGLCAAPAALTPVTIVAGPGTVTDSLTAAHFDFGTHAASDDSPLVHVFILRNVSAAPILLERLETSCGCTTAVAGETGSLPLTLASGQSVPIRLQLSPRRLLPGEVHKFVWAYFQGAENTPILLEMRGTEQTADPLPTTLRMLASAKPAMGRHLSAPGRGQIAPILAGTDISGRKFALTAARGRPTVLLFFCGCPWCAAAARSWGQVQRSGTLPAGTQTVIIFAGDSAATHAFAASNTLGVHQTTLLPDPTTHLTEEVYKVSACPRVFALDAHGVIRYTNNHPDDQPRQASSATLTSRLRTTLNSAR